jgi:hypothetical protein|tara:strand:- start:7123 stop:7383 length:261 start_codon:yes stop_codon:yes gene_type:complete
MISPVDNVYSVIDERATLPKKPLDQIKYKSTPFFGKQGVEYVETVEDARTKKVITQRTVVVYLYNQLGAPKPAPLGFLGQNVDLAV